MPFDLFKKKRKDPRDSLTPTQKLFTNPFISKAIDFISAGQTLEEAEKVAKEQKEGITRFLTGGHKIIPALNPFAPVEQQEEALEVLKTPLETIFRPSTAIKRSIPPLLKGDFADIPKEAIQGLIRPDLTPEGYLGGEARKLFPPPTEEQGLFTLPNIAAAGLGTAGDLISMSLGLGTAPRTLKGISKNIKTRGAFRSGEELVDKVTKSILKQRDPKLVSKGKTLTPKIRKFEDVRLDVRKAILGSEKPGEILRPGAFDILEKAQTPKKLAADWIKSVKKVLVSEVGEKKLVAGKDIVKGIKKIPKTEAAVIAGAKIPALLKPTLKEKPIVKAEPEKALTKEFTIEETKDPLAPKIIDKSTNLEHTLSEEEVAHVDKKKDIEIVSRDIERSSTPQSEVYKKKFKLRKQKVSKIAKELKERGFVDYRGKLIVEDGDVAEIVAAFRHPKIEQFQIVYVKNSKVVAHRVLTSGHPSSVNFNKKTLYKINNVKEKLKADQVYIAHNHPTGDVNASIQDIAFTRAIEQLVKGDFGGHIVTNGDEFLFLKESSSGSMISERRSYLKKKEKHIVDLPKISNSDNVAEAARDFIRKGKISVIFLGSDNSILSIDNIGATKNIGQYVKDHFKVYGSIRYILSLDRSESVAKIKDLPAGLLDVVKIGKDGYISYNEGSLVLPKHIKPFEPLKDPKNAVGVQEPPAKPPTEPPVAQGVPEEPEFKPIPTKKVKGIVREATGLKKPVIPVKMSERAALKRELGQEQKESRKGFIAGRRLGAEEATMKIRTVLSKQKERKELSTEVKRLIKNIQTKPTKDLPIEYKDAIDDIKSNIDFEKVRLSNILKREKALKLVDEDVREAAKELASINAEDMTLSDLQEVDDIVSQIYHSGVHEHRFLSNEIKIEHDKAILKAAEQLKPKKAKKSVLPLEKILREESPTSRRKRTAKHYLYADRRPEAIFEELDNFKEGGVFTDTVWNPTIEGTNKYYDALDKATKDISAITDPMKGKLFLEMFKVGEDWINAGGKTIDIPGIKTKITRSDAMAVYAHSQNKTNTAHLKAMGFTDAQINNVISQLSTEEKKVVDDVIDYLTNELFPSVDKTNVALKGTHLNQVDRYFPITGLQDLGSTKAVEIDLKAREDYRRKGMVTSFAKEREVTDSTTKGFKRLDFFSTLYNHIKNVSYYNNMAIPIRDASKVLRNPTIRNSIKNKYESSLNIINDRWIDSIKTNKIPGATTPIMNFIDTIGKNAVTFFVSGNLSTATKQTASFLQGAEYIGKVNAASGLLQVMVNPLGILEFASNRSTLIRERAKGLNIERDFQEMLAGKGAAGKFGVKDTDAAKKLKNVYGTAKVISMTPLRMFDMSTVLSIWKGAYDSKIANNIPSAEAVKFADKSIRRSQPMSGVINLADNFRAGTMLRQLTRLRNQPNQNMNLLVDTVQKFAQSENKGKAAKKFGSNLIWMYIAPAIMFGALSRKRWYREGKEGVKEFAYDMINYGIGGFTGMSGLFNAAAAPYFSSDLYNSWLDKIKDISQGRGEAAKQKAMLTAVGITVGAPAGGQIVKGIFGKDLQQKLLGGESQATRLKYEYKAALRITDKKERLARIKEINRKVKKKGLSVAKVTKDGKSWLRNDLRDKHKIEGNIDDLKNLRIMRKMSKEERGMLIRTYSASSQEKIRNKL